MSESSTSQIDPGLQDDDELAFLLRTSPIHAVVKANTYLEVAIRNLAGDLGFASASEADWRLIAQDLIKRGLVSPETRQAVDGIVALRNRVVHDGSADEREIALIVDGAITIIRAIRAIPREVHRAYSLVPIYRDEAAMTPHVGVEGLIMCSFDYPGTQSQVRIFPTQDWYEPGARLVWRWDVQRALDQAWFRFPVSGVVTKAWDKSALFTGSQMLETDASARYWLREIRSWAIRTSLVAETVTDVKEIGQAVRATDAKPGPAGVWFVWHVAEATNERMAVAVVRSAIEVALTRAPFVAQILDSYVYPETSVQVGYMGT
jgi:hypothetical protein